MGSEWEEIFLRDCADFQEGYVNPTQKKEEYFDGPIKWLRAVDLNNGFVYNTSRTLSVIGFESAGKSALLFEPDTIGISKSGTIGRVGILKDFMCGNRAVINVKPHKNIATRFIFYILKYYRPTIELLATGSVQPNLYISALGSLKFQLPPLPEQKAIAHILGSLDNKIELNRKMNQTLEAMAQALFKSWFVDFDPVIDNALAAGNPIPEALQQRAEQRRSLQKQPQQKTAQDKQTNSQNTLPNDIRKLFPNAFYYSEELGWVPEGWGVGSFGDFSKHIKQNIKADDIQPDSLYVGLEHISRKCLFLSEGGLGKDITSNKSLFYKNDLLFGKLRPYFHKLCICPTDGICSTDILVFRQKEPIFRSFMILTAYSEAFVEFANLRSTGTRMPRASVKDMLSFQTLIPENSILEKFEKQCNAIWEKAILSERASQELAKLRDILLPKLISGELRIPDAEKLIEKI